MGGHWFLLLLLLLSRDRAFHLPSGASVWVLASDSASTKSSVHNRNLPCQSTSSSLSHSTKGHDSTKEPNSSSVPETPTSKSQGQMTSPTLSTSPQSRGTAGPTERMTAVHTPAMTMTNNMSLSDSTMTPAVKESIGTSKTTVLFSLAISAETPQLNQTPPSSTLDKARDTHKPLPMTTMAVIHTPSSTTVTPETTVLSTVTAETQEKDAAAVPPSPAATPTTSKPPDTLHNSVTQTPSQSAQVTSDAGMTLDTTPSPPKSTSTRTGSSMSPSSGDTGRTMTTPSTPTVTEKSALTPPSSTLDKARDTQEPLPTTTMAVIHTPSSTTASPETTVLSTVTAETQEKDAAAVPPTPGTTPTTSKPPDTQHSSVTQTPSQSAQMASDAGMTLDTTPSPPKSTSTRTGSSMSPSSGDTGRTMTTPSMALNIISTPEDAIPTSGTGTPTASEKSALTSSSVTLDKVLPMTTMAVTNTPSSTTVTPGTTVLSTATAETQEKDAAAVPPTPGTTTTTNKPPDTQHNSVTQTPSQPAQMTSDAGMTLDTTPSPPKSTSTRTGSSMSPSSGDTGRTMTTPSMALNIISTPEDAILTSGTGTPTASEKSALTSSSVTLDKVLPMTTMAVTNTPSSTTVTPGTTVLSTVTAETQEKDAAAVPPTPAATTTTSKPPDTQCSSVTQTPSQSAQMASDAGMTLDTTPPPPKSTSTRTGSFVSPSSGDTGRTMTTPSMALNIISTPEDAILTSGTGTPTASEKSALTSSSVTLDKVLPMTTMAVTNTPSSTTVTPGTTVLSTVTAETQEKDAAAVPPTPGTTPTTSKPPDTQHSSVTQTPSQSAQMASDAGMTLDTTPSPPKSTKTGMGSFVSPSSGDTGRTMTTPSTPTVTEKSALTPPSSTLDKAKDTQEPLPTTITAVTNTPSSTTVTPGTTVLSTVTAETQEKDAAAVPPTPGTTPTTSKPPDTQHNSMTQTSSQPAQTGSSTGTGTARSPEHSTDLLHNASETTKSSTIIGTSQAPPNSNQSSGPGGGACALDEYLDNTGGCVCNNSYFSHLEPSSEIGTLHCEPEVIEVALRSCFLKNHHWVLKKDVFSGCSSTNTIDQGHRVQVFQLEKKEGTCGLHISTNISHALHSVHVHLEQAHPGSGSRVLHFSCAYPLVVNVSKPVSYQEASIPTIHVPGTGETVITLSVFTDLQLHRPLQDRTAPVGTPLYVVLKSTSSDPDRFALVANEVFASSDLSNTVAKATYHFVNESCPVGDRLLQDLNNGASIQVTLAFTLLRFLNSDTLYLHAQVTLCDKQASRPCQPSCSGKNSLRRNSPWDSRVGTHLEPGGSKWIRFGPLRISEPRASSSRSRAGAWMSILLLMVIGWMLD